MNTLIKNNTEVKNSSFTIQLADRLTSAEAHEIRTEIDTCLSYDFQTIYIDTRHVINADLSGINEIIHTAYILSDSSKELVIVYSKQTAISKWVDTTSLDRFVKTALIP